MTALHNRIPTQQLLITALTNPSAQFSTGDKFCYCNIRPFRELIQTHIHTHAQPPLFRKYLSTQHLITKILFGSVYTKAINCKQKQIHAHIYETYNALGLSATYTHACTLWDVCVCMLFNISLFLSVFICLPPLLSFPSIFSSESLTPTTPHDTFSFFDSGEVAV